MSFLKNIKLRIAYSVLNNKVRKQSRKKGTFNLDSAKTVGIIINARNKDFFQTVQQFVSFLKSKHIDVWSLGYTDSQDVIEAYAYQIGMNHFTKKNLNWYYKPKGNNIDQFIRKEFDILIDLSLIEFFPIHYLIGMSKAKMKIGRYIENNLYYDLMIDIDKNNNLEFLIEQIKHYLSIIKLQP